MGHTIAIHESEPNVFKVHVSDATGAGGSTHTVRIDEAYLGELGWEPEDTGTLIRESFEFLLEREAKEAILSEFDLRDIAIYFPEYPDTISK